MKSIVGCLMSSDARMTTPWRRRSRRRRWRSAAVRSAIGLSAQGGKLIALPGIGIARRRSRAESRSPCHGVERQRLGRERRHQCTTRACREPLANGFETVAEACAAPIFLDFAGAVFFEAFTGR
jgi:hypothetical protein